MSVHILLFTYFEQVGNEMMVILLKQVCLFTKVNKKQKAYFLSYILMPQSSGVSLHGKAVQLH